MRDLIEPGIKADQIDGNGGKQMLEVRLRSAQVAGAAQLKGSDSLRDGSFNPCSLGVFLLEGLSLLLAAGSL
jgi:hypothetical protein